MTSSLQKLADTIGILTSYTDACNQEHEIEDNVIRLLAEKLGYKAGNEEEIARSIELYHKKRWQKTLESISVVEQKDIWFDVVLPENHDTSDLKLRLRYRGNERSFEPGFGVFDEGGRYTIGHTVYKKVVVKINGRLEVGYYEIELETGGKKYKSVLAVAPEKCYANETLEKERLWGFAVQLYSLNSSRNWGIGDFTDLYNLVDICKRSGADVIGLNPLNVLSHDFPEDASPYGSVSRLFLNPIYIDVEKVPGFTPEDMASCRDKVAGLRDSELIQYTPVYELKITMLEKLYRRMLRIKNRRIMPIMKPIAAARARSLISWPCFRPCRRTGAHGLGRVESLGRRIPQFQFAGRG